MENNKKNAVLSDIRPEWREHISAQTEKVRALHENGGRSFIFYTDTHIGGKHDPYSASLIDYSRKALGINTVIFGGDPIRTGDSRANATELVKRFADEEFFGVHGDACLYAVGNHETNTCYARCQKDRYEALVTDTDLYDLTVGQLERLGKKIVFDDRAIAAAEHLNSFDISGFDAEEVKKEAVTEMKMHYYYDDNDAKIRYIILDTGGMGITQCALFGGLTWGGLGWCSYTLLQLGWLVDTLETTPDGYDVMVAGHMVVSDSPVGVTNWTTYEFTENINGALYDGVHEHTNALLSLFKLGKSGEYTVKNEKIGDIDEKIYENIMNMASSAASATRNGDSITFKYDFSGRKNKNVAVAFFTGHSHCDRSWISGYDSKTGEYASYRCYGDDDFEFSIDGGILGIMTTCDCADQQTKTRDIFEMTPGTSTASVFDIVTIMPDGGIYCTRVGGGKSRAFKEYR